MDENRNAVAIRKSRLKHAMLIRLNAVGGFAWESPRTSSGMPTINLIFGGAYYGFYPSGFPDGTGRDISDTERNTMKQITENGAQCAVVANLDSLEDILNLNARTLEIRRKLPRKAMIALLKEWGAGKAVDTLLDREILALRPDLRKVIFGVYIDKNTFNEIGEALETPTRTIINRHERALHVLADRIVSHGTYMEGLGGMKSNKRAE